MSNAKTEDFLPLLKYLTENKAKLKIFLSADEKMKDVRYAIKGKKSSKTIFMSEGLQFLMKEFCIENDCKLGDFVELAVIEYLNRNGFSDKLKDIIDSDFPPKKLGETGEKA